jgi:hypothetical protein
LRADPGQIRSDSHRRSRSSASRNPRPAVASARPSGSQPVPGRCAGSRTAHAVTLPGCGSRRARVAPAVVRLTPLRFQDAAPSHGRGRPHLEPLGRERRSQELGTKIQSPVLPELNPCEPAEGPPQH